MPALELTRHDQTVATRFHLVEARIDWDDGSTSRGFGRDRSPALAERKAVMEAIERSCFVRMPSHRRCRAEALDRRLHPDELVRYEEWQYRLGGFPMRPFDAADMRRWVPARRVCSDDETWVLAEFVCSPRAFAPAERGGLVTHASTSGCASADRADDALLRATLELVERDAFMRHWFAQRPGLAIDPRSLGEEVRDRLAALEGAGCRAGLQCLDLGVHPTWLAWAQHPGLCFTSVGCASGLAADTACDAALLELETVALARLQGVPARALEPEDVRRPEDHAALYATAGHFGDADALFRPADKPVAVDSIRVEASAAALYERLEAHGHRLHVVELGDGETGTDPSGAPVHTVRALATGLIPMSFGYARMPLGMDRWHRADPRTIHPFS